MGIVSGADLDGMDRLRAALVRGSNAIHTVERAASGQMPQLHRLWHGADAAQFSQRWNASYRLSLRAAALALDDAAETIARNRAAQETTSAANGGSGFHGSPKPNAAGPTVVTFNAEQELTQGPADDSDIAAEVARIDDLLSYSWRDWNVNRGEQEEALAIVLNSDNLPALIAELDKEGELDLLIGRVDDPELQLQLMRELGAELDVEGRDLVLPHIREQGLGPEIQFHLGQHGLEISTVDFDREPYADLVSDDPGDPFTGVGATGINPQERGIDLIDQVQLGLDELGLGSFDETVEYGNPTLTSEFGEYYSGLSAEDRQRQAELLVGQPISSDPTDVYHGPNASVRITGVEDSYAGHLPSRGQIIELAADRYDLEPELITAFLLTEARDQTGLEDAKDYAAAVSPLEGNTSIGLGQVLPSTVENRDLFRGLLSEETRSNLSHSQIAQLLASDEVNIFAVGEYIRQVANEGAHYPTETILGGWESRYPDLEPGAWTLHSSEWPEDNMRILASEYTSSQWDGGLVHLWGDLVVDGYNDAHNSQAFD